MQGMNFLRPLKHCGREFASHSRHECLRLFCLCVALCRQRPCGGLISRARSPTDWDGEDGLQIWKVAANILTKRSWTTGHGWSSSLGVGRGLTTPHSKKSLLRKITRSLRPGRILLIKNIDWGCLRTGCWVAYLVRREIKLWEIGENCIMRSFITCTLHQT
jgi:hypothetical protein